MKKYILLIISVICAVSIPLNAEMAEISPWYYQNGMPAEENSTGEVSARILMNDFDKDTEYSFFLASYNSNGSLNDVSLKTTAGSSIVEIPSVKNNAGGSVKAFVWDDMIPLKSRSYYEETFEKDSVGKLPSYNPWTITVPENTSARIAYDPEDRTNKVLKLEDKSTSDKIGAVYTLPKKTDGVYSISWRMYCERTADFEKGNIDAGMNWIHARTKSGETIMSMSMNDSESGMGYVYTKSDSGEEASQLAVAINTWHDMTMVYCNESEIKFYVDGRYICSKKPLTTDAVSKISIFTTNSRVSTMYIDDIVINYNDIPEYEELNEAYETIDSYFVNVFDWLAELYDPQTGGFYSTVSGAKHEGYYPSIEATGFFCAMMTDSESGALKAMPNEFKEKLIRFFQNRQDPKTGWFSEEWEKADTYSDRDKMRVHLQAVDKLALLGGAPLYPLPGETEIAYETSMQLMSADENNEADVLELPAGVPEYFKTVDALISEIESRQWDSDSWSAGDKTATDLDYVRMLPESVRQDYLDAVFDWFEEHQDPQTGYWAGNGSINFNAVSGAFKVCMAYNNFGRCPPNAMKIAESAMETLRQGYSANMACYVRNPVTLFEILIFRDNDVRDFVMKHEDEIVELYAKYIGDMMLPDGGAATAALNAVGKFGGLCTGGRGAESDIDGMQQMWLARKYLYNIFGRTVSNSFLERYYDEFWNKLMTKPPIKKEPYDAAAGVVFAEDFNDIKSIDELTVDGWGFNSFNNIISSRGLNDNYLMIDDRLASDIESCMGYFPRVKSGVVECELMFNRDDKYIKNHNDVSYNYFRLYSDCINVIELHAIDSGSDTLSLAISRIKGTESARTYTKVATIPRGEWIKLKIEFDFADDGTVTASYYINDNLIPLLNNQVTRDSRGFINGIGLYTSGLRIAQLSIDNIKVTSY